jgi:CO/xanthine dehydrogenase FAD-binding subunit
MASAQIRNVATIGGNIVNASPAGDLISPLLLLDGRLHIASAGGGRVVPIDSFFTGPGETVLKRGELLTEIHFDLPAGERIFRFVKAGTRPAMECSLVTVGIAYSRSRDLLREVRVAFGSVASTPLRGRKTEAVLEGRRPEESLIAEALAAAGEEIDPISDVRGSCDYRRAVVSAFLKRLLEEAVK